MAGILFAAYGAICYLFFLVTFLYAIAFVGDLPVPKTIDSGAPGPLAPSLMVDFAILGLFAVQHSLMARPGFKRWWTRIVPPPIERSTYVLFANLVLVALFVQWRPLTQIVWSVSGPLAILLTALSFVGYAIVLISSFLINHFELFGMKQVLDRLMRRPAGGPEFVTPAFYRIVRHPLYVGFILAFWSTPRMTLGHLLFAAGTLGYMLIAIQLEERDMVDAFGDLYRDYRRKVGMLLPRI